MNNHSIGILETTRTPSPESRDIPPHPEPQRGLGRDIVPHPTGDDTLVSQPHGQTSGPEADSESHVRQQVPITEKKWQKLLTLGQAEKDLPELSEFLAQFAHHLTDLNIEANTAETLSVTGPERPKVIKDFIVKGALRMVAERIEESETFNNPDVVIQLLDEHIHSLKSRELVTCMEKLAQDPRVARHTLCQILSKRRMVKSDTQVDPDLEVLAIKIIKPELEQTLDPDQLIRLLGLCGDWLSEQESCAYVNKLVDDFHITIAEIIEHLHSYEKEFKFGKQTITSFLFLACWEGVKRANTEAEKQNILACWFKHSKLEKHPQALPLIHVELGADQAWSQFERMKKELEQREEPTVETDLYPKAQVLWPDKVELYTDPIALIVKHHWFHHNWATAKFISPQEYAFDACIKGLVRFGDNPAKSRAVFECWHSVANLDKYPEYLTQLWEAFGERLTEAGINLADLQPEKETSPQD